MATPTILDTLPVSGQWSLTDPNAFSYTCPAGGSNRLLVLLIASNTGHTITGNYGGASITFVQTHINFTPGDSAWYSYVGYLANPTAGTATVTITVGGNSDSVYTAITLQNAMQTSPLDIAEEWSTSDSTHAISETATTGVGDDLLLSIGIYAGNGGESFGTGETTVLSRAYSSDYNYSMISSWKAAGASPGSETMSYSYSASGLHAQDLSIIGVKHFVAAGPAGVKTKDGITQSTGIKTYEGLAIASVKSVEGVT